MLYKALLDLLKNHRKQHAQKNPSKRFENNIIVIGIPRGGVIIADVISKKLSCEIDIVIPRKLRAPHNEELAIGAVVEDGTLYLNHEIVNNLQISEEYIEQQKIEQIKEIKRRKSLYQRNQQSNIRANINGKIVVLVDDGIATGATMIAGARWIKKYQPKYLIIAAPVATKETMDLLKKEADEVEILSVPPHNKFQTVAQFYQDFRPIEDIEVKEMLSR